MTLSAYSAQTGSASHAKTRRAVETTSQRALHAIDALLSETATQFAAGEIYSLDGQPLVDKASAVRLDAAAAALTAKALGLTDEATLSFKALHARAAERHGLEGELEDVVETAPCMAHAVVQSTQLEWAACLAFGEKAAGEDVFLRERFAALLLADMAALERRINDVLGEELPTQILRAIQPAVKTDGAVLAGLRAAIASGEDFAAARAAIVSEILDARGVLGPDELQRQAIRDLPMAGWATSRGKRIFDIVVASAMLIGLSPLLIVILVMMAFEKGPIFFAHQRIGLNGRLFPCLKFRTMIPNAQAVLEEVLAKDPALAKEWAETQKLRNDPRITKLGWFLRKTSVDELPQLINVLRGEMTLVGARPIILEEAKHWGPYFSAYKMAKPGLTGPWQIFFRSTSDYESRVEMLKEYFNRASALYDLRMVLLTGLTPFDTKKAA